MTKIIVLTLCIVTPLSSMRGEEALPEPSFRLIDLTDLRRHVSVLAADSLEGRQAGSQGAKAAAAYIRSELKKHERLKPGGPEQDWMQPFGANYANVLAELPAAEGVTNPQTILLGAHYDHVGFGNKSNSYGPFGRIHNGADDNASGCAALLELAESLSHEAVALPCRVLFAFWDAEEAGLLGSQHWVRSPTVPLAQLRLAMNVDMVGRLRDNRVYVMGWRSAAGLRPQIAHINAEPGLTFQFEQFVTSDSDHYSFYSSRVPVLHFDTGKHSDYHRPSDDVDKLAWDGLLQITQLMGQITYTTARSKTATKFRTECWAEKPSVLRNDARLPPPTRLGIAWDTKAAEMRRVRVIQVVSGSAAERAGLRVGDSLKQLGTWSGGAIEDLRTTITTSPATPIPVSWERGDPPTLVTAEVHLSGDPVSVGCRFIADPAVPEAVLVSEVQATTPCDRAGLRPGDYLLTVNGEPTLTPANCHRLLGTVSNDATLTVERQGRLERLVFRRPRVVIADNPTRSEATP